MTGPRPEEIPIVILGPDDAKSLAGLHRVVFAKPWSAEDFRRLLTGSGALGLAAARAGEVHFSGFVIVRVMAGEAEFLSLGVRASVRRCGIGRALLAAALNHAKARGCRTAFLEVAVDNSAAIRLYENAGFDEAGQRLRYYRRPGGPAADAMILSCPIGIAVDGARTPA